MASLEARLWQFEAISPLSELVEITLLVRELGSVAKSNSVALTSTGPVVYSISGPPLTFSSIIGSASSSASSLVFISWYPLPLGTVSPFASVSQSL